MGGNGTSHPTCSHCGSTKSPLWRRGMHSEILCNACGLYWKHHGTYRPLSLKAAADKKDTVGGSSSGARVKTPTSSHAKDVLGTGHKRESALRRLKSALLTETGIGSGNQDMRRITPVKLRGLAGALGEKSGGGYFLQMQTHGGGGRMRSEPIFPPILPPTTGSANVRLVPAQVRVSGEIFDSPVIHPNEGIVPILPSKQHLKPVPYLMWNGRLLFIGDHVAVRGDDAQIYFAIITDFWMVPRGSKYVRLQWLLPDRKYALEIDGPSDKIDPAYFMLGPMHGKPEPVEAILDVFFSPQRVCLPLETPLWNMSTSMSRSVTPTNNRRSSCTLDNNDFTSSLFGSGLSTPMQGKRKREGEETAHAHSDSEVEINRPRQQEGGDQRQQKTSILEDVEMAHLLCNISS